MATFKVLTFGPIDELDNHFVDEILLRKGIYITSVPNLHSDTFTIEKMKKNWKCILKNDMNTSPNEIEFILSNINKCQLTKVELILV